jgi:hypothetical protein
VDHHQIRVKGGGRRLVFAAIISHPRNGDVIALYVLINLLDIPSRMIVGFYGSRLLSLLVV